MFKQILGKPNKVVKFKLKKIVFPAHLRVLVGHHVHHEVPPAVLLLVGVDDVEEEERLAGVDGRPELPSALVHQVHVHHLSLLPPEWQRENVKPN